MSAVEAVPAWPLELGEHLSATKLSMLTRCPEQYRQRYVLGKKQRPGAAMLLGRADHGAIGENFTQKITSGTDLPMSDVEGMFVAQLERAIEEEGGVGEIAWGDKPTDKDQNAIEQTGLSIVRAYHQQASPLVQPTAVEHKIELAVPGLPVPVVGYIDVVTADRIIERKTTGARLRVPKPEWRLQGMIYRAALDKPVDWHVSTKTKTPSVTTPADEAGLRLANADPALTLRIVGTRARQLHALWLMYGPDEPWPDAIHHDWSCNFCGYRRTCAWWNE